MLGSKQVINKSGQVCHELMFEEGLFISLTHRVAESQLNMITINLFYLFLSGVSELAQRRSMGQDKGYQ